MNNTANYNVGSGISLYSDLDSVNNNITGNTANWNAYDGIGLYYSSYGNIAGNWINGNGNSGLD